MTQRSAHQPRQGVGLALSGGGYRAMLYHLGALRRLSELGLLSQLERVSSVSGGSILAGVLATRWAELGVAVSSASLNMELVERPLIELAQTTVDMPSVLLGLLPGTSSSTQLARRYDRLLFHGASIQDLPTRPRFTFNTTNMTNGNLFRWSKDYAADHGLGRIDNPEISLAAIVAASSAFPPFLAPAHVRLPGDLVGHDTGSRLQDQPRYLWLADGGIYDNLGVQTLESYPTVLVSDGGAPLPNAVMRSNWISQMLRTTYVIDAQVRRLRHRALIRDLDTGAKKGALWSISTPMEAYPAFSSPANERASSQLAELPTRLKKLPNGQIAALLDWGYSSADAAIRINYLPDAPEPRDSPRWAL